jgi:general secretion pathway protein C
MNRFASLQGLHWVAIQDGLQRHAQHAPKVVAGLLTIVAAWQLAHLTWLLWPHAAVDASASAAPIGMPVTTAAAIDVQRIANAHLFGEASAATPDATDLANAPRTSIPLVLSGTIATDDPMRGFAFIGESLIATKFLRVGDVVGGAARLHSVYFDRVILDRDGQLEAMYLPRNAALGAMFRPVVVAPPPPSQFVEKVNRLAALNPSSFSQIIRPMPVFAGGKMKGLIVNPGHDREQFESLGLNPGDLVTAVNGTPLDNPARSREVLSALMHTDKITVTIERDGQEQTLNLSTNQIKLPDAPAPPEPDGGGNVAPEPPVP